MNSQVNTEAAIVKMIQCDSPLAIVVSSESCFSSHAIRNLINHYSQQASIISDRVGYPVPVFIVEDGNKIEFVAPPKPNGVITRPFDRGDWLIVNRDGHPNDGQRCTCLSFNRAESRVVVLMEDGVELALLADDIQGWNA